MAEGQASAQSAEATPATTTSPASQRRVEVALLGSGPAVIRVREATEELLAREGYLVSWSSPARLSPEEIVAPPAPGQAPGARSTAVWIDLQSSTQAGLNFRNASFDRFVVRRVLLGHGLDEIAKEEIAYIVASVVVALDAGTTATLSRAEATVALGARPGAEVSAARALASEAGSPSSSPSSSSSLQFEIGPWASAQAFSREIPRAFTFELALGLIRATQSRGLPGAWGAWLSVGMEPPSRYAGSLIALDLRTTLLRAGALWQLALSRRIAFRVSAGGGIDRVNYQPRSLDPSVIAEASGSFLIPTARAATGVGFAIAEHVTLGLAIVAEVSLADVHYDLREPGGQVRIVVPFEVRPGLAGGAMWRF